MKKIILFFVIVTAAVQLHAQSTAKTVIRGGFGIWSADIGYLASANSKNYKHLKPIWAGNGYAAAINYRWGDRFGIAGKAGYSGGKTNEKNAQSFANSLVTSPFTAKVSGLKNNWSQVNIAAGPSIMVGKKYKGEISGIAGVSFSSGNTVTIDKYDAQTKMGTIFTVTEKKVKPFWEVSASYRVAYVKRVGFMLKGGYNSNGFTVGIVASDIYAICCRRTMGDCCKM